MRRLITEARLLSRFKKLFGGPVKGKGFRTLFRKAGYGGVPGGRVPNELHVQRVRRRVGDAQDVPGVREREPRDRIEPAVSCAMD